MVRRLAGGKKASNCVDGLKQASLVRGSLRKYYCVVNSVCAHPFAFSFLSNLSAFYFDQ